tara:strand:- start:1877 stop:2707 length:831 start_codon:yes stop_codon:yes gene_type:complete
MIIDTFVFSEELDLLEVRLNELDSVVDYFVIVEASKTQSRLDKPLFFKENSKRYEKFLHKIVHVVLDDYADGGDGCWKMEHYQRRSIGKGLQDLVNKGVQIRGGDFIMISDVDEIPKASKVLEAVALDKETVSLNHKFGSYFLNMYAPSRNWYGTVIVKAGVLPECDIQALREYKDHMDHVDDAGWHFSNIGGFDALWNKWLTRIEPHDKSIFEPDGAKDSFRAAYAQHVLNDKYFMFCDDLPNKSIKLEVMEQNELPEFIRDNPKTFAKYTYVNF